MSVKILVLEAEIKKKPHHYSKRMCELTTIILNNVDECINSKIR